MTLIGTEEEVFPLAVWHAVRAHGHEDTPELRQMIRDELAKAPTVTRETA